MIEEGRAVTSIIDASAAVHHLAVTTLRGIPSATTRTQGQVPSCEGQFPGTRTIPMNRINLRRIACLPRTVR